MAKPSPESLNAPAVSGCGSSGIVLPMLSDLGFAAWFLILSATTFSAQPVAASLYGLLGGLMLLTAAATFTRRPGPVLFAFIMHSLLFALLLLILLLAVVFFLMSDFAGDRMRLIAGVLVLGVAAWRVHQSTQLLRRSREAAAAVGAKK